MDPWDRWIDDDEATMTEGPLSAQLERTLLLRLAEAWRDINYLYLGGRLKPPSIRLHHGERRWGAWHADTRLITISRRQVLCYTWESVVETLKHEMAHQYVWETLQAHDEPPHGRVFQEVCAKLRCSPAASDDGGIPLFRPRPAREVSDDDARLAKIQKLLALADRNPDEHEARAAFARASELMRKYNVTTQRSRQPSDYVYRHLGSSSGRIAHHRYVIASLLQEHYFVQCIWVDSYTVRTGVRGHRLEIMGTRSNVDMAEYVHDCLARSCETLWRAYKTDAGVTDRRAKRQYLDGLLTGFRRQLERSAIQSEAKGLVWAGDPGLTRYARRRYPRTTRSKLGGVDGSEARDAGVAAGERLRLHRPLERPPGSSRGRLLPG
jgi:hypothetical protein